MHADDSPGDAPPRQKEQEIGDEVPSVDAARSAQYRIRWAGTVGGLRIREPRFNEAPQRLIGRARGEALPLHVAWLCVHYLLFRGKLAGFVSALRRIGDGWGMGQFLHSVCIILGLLFTPCKPLLL